MLFRSLKFVQNVHCIAHVLSIFISFFQDEDVINRM